MPASAVSFASSPFAGSQKRLLRAQRGGSSRQREGRSRATRVAVAAAANKEVWLLDYGAGNVRSVRNAIKYLGYNVRDVTSPADVAKADRLLFPGVGAIGTAVDVLKSRGYWEPLKEYLHEGKPFFGICLGLQLLFEGSEESGGVEGLGVIPGRVRRFDASALTVPHIGWNGLNLQKNAPLLEGMHGSRVYFVHSYRATPDDRNKDWIAATTAYGPPFVAAVQKGAINAAQFHPEKSGPEGLKIMGRFLSGATDKPSAAAAPAAQAAAPGLARRVIACLDVRANDQGDLVVTKGDSYDVREASGSKDVRNLGKPVELAGRYFKEGADEVTFLNITGYRDMPLKDAPMLEVLRRASKSVFVPLTVGGGIRDFTDSNGKHYGSLEVAAEYFRSGADKISIGSDAVAVAEAYYASGGKKDGSTSIEQISSVYGAQAVVVSIDPRRVYVKDPKDVKHACVRAGKKGPNGEEWAWYQCTVNGGRAGRDLGAMELAKAVEALGAGEILLNCIDEDGQGNGFDLELVRQVSSAVRIPVIASSGAGKPSHFTDVFNGTGCSAALAAGIFHRKEVSIREVKEHMANSGLPTRLTEVVAAAV